ncbi:hypothetical protein NDU88_001937 [Pleurodeles waltl]|uniref:Uncharacterized protein n=1 Tax=Pleurodeles waltl TaxID=8319 RepID=A0AAV7U8A0_PLEWA|nr:hypothetical protein NDU88_001937 [Pleurodeles waltl]
MEPPTAQLPSRSHVKQGCSAGCLTRRCVLEGFRTLEETLWVTPALEFRRLCAPDPGPSPYQPWAGSDMPGPALQGVAQTWCPWGCCSP